MGRSSMISKNGTLIFSEYKILEKRHGPDDAMKYAQEIINRLELRNVLHNHPTDVVRKAAWHEYDILKAEWT